MKAKELDWKCFSVGELYAKICFGLELRISERRTSCYTCGLYLDSGEELDYFGKESTMENAKDICQKYYEEGILEEVEDE